MICRLCHKEAILENSHVIPEFMYSSLYDEKHRFQVLSTEREEKNSFEQKGIREALLCSDCENQLSQSERYVSLVFRGDIDLTIEKDGKLIIIDGLNYKAFRLFALSVLWRAGVSTKQMFEQVKLGPHEEILRQMVLNNDPGTPETYPFILSPLVHLGKPQFNSIVQPAPSRLNGHFVYRFVFGGLVWVFLVSSHKPPDSIEPAIISRDGKLTMCTSELEDVSFILNMARELKKHGKFKGTR